MARQRGTVSRETVRMSVSRETVRRVGDLLRMSRRSRGACWVLGVLVIACGTSAPSAAGQATTVQSFPTPLVVPARSDVPPPGYTRTVREVARIAEADPRVRSERAEHPPAYVRTYTAGGGRWQVSFYVPPSGDRRSEEIVQAVIGDRSGRVLEVWTGPQVAWTMARGSPGQFGRAVNAPWVWIGLCALFVAPFLRPPLRMLHLDLAVLLAFSVSYAFFGAANLDVSVPSAYPLLAYLLGRMLWIGFAGPRAAPQSDRRRSARPRRACAPPGRAARTTPPIRLAVTPSALLLGAVFLLGFRIVLNVTNGNVIDVGYASVIGGDRLLHGDPLYGAFPPDNPHGDTYGPLTYLAYAPFVLALPWGGTWDALPAAHAAALVFDLACVAGLWVAGRRLGGGTLGVLLAYLWLACPFTLLVANSGANDALVAALVLGAFLAIDRPAARGALAVAAGLTKFAPLALVPLFVRAGPRPARSLLAAGAVGLAVLLPVLLGPGLERFWDRTLGFQGERSSPFSVWGLYGGLEVVQALVTLAAAALAVAVAFVPRRRDPVTIAALAAAVLIALQLAVEHWFYLYIVWFLPLLLIALLARTGVTAPDAAPARSPRLRRPARTGSARR